MKLTKILSSVACFALVGAFMFTSCDGNIGSDDIVVTEGGAKASINAENTSTEEYRRTLSKSSTFSKKEVTSTITFENQTKSSGNGVMGLAFDYHTTIDSDGDTVYDFGVVALKAASGKMDAYISYYKNVGADYISGNTGNFCDKKGKVIGESGCLAKETQIIPTSGIWESLYAKYYAFDEEKGTVVSAINVAVQNDGAFLVKIAKDVAGLKGTKDTDYVEYTVPTVNTSVDTDKATSFAYYANVYKATSSGSNTLKGTWNTSF